MDKIAYVANSRIPSRAANTVHVLNMSAAFAARGTDVRLIARGDPSAAASVFHDFGLEKDFELSLLPLARPPLLDRLRFVRHVRKTLAAAGVEFAYGRSCYGLLAGVPPTIPVAYDLHIFPEAWWQVRLESLLFRRPNFLFATAITRAVAEKYESVYPHLRGRMLVAPCAANLPPEPPASGARRSGPLRVYYVGHLYKGRGIDFILDLAGLEPQFEFHIVGGEDADIAFWSEQAPANVRFHGYLKPAELAGQYREADLCIAPHRGRVEMAGGGGDISSWMSPMKIFEYMAHRKAVVAADLPVLREIVEPGVDGLLCPPGELEAWRGAIRRLADDPALRSRLGEAARRKLEREHTWEHRARRILDRAREMLEPAAAGEAIAVAGRP